MQRLIAAAFIICGRAPTIVTTFIIYLINNLRNIKYMQC